MDSFDNAPLPTPIFPDRLRQRIPPRFEPCFDRWEQAWYYFDTQTGRSQWEAPGYEAPNESAASAQEYYPGHGGYPGGGYGGPRPSADLQETESDYGGRPGGHGDQAPPAESRTDSSDVLLGATSGLATGAIGGTLLQHALSGGK